MTAEIAIMNQKGIALAADSAVTVNTAKGEKIFLSANKLFTMSKYHPVGVMIYNNASFLGIDWEIIIKLYRKNLGEKSFNLLSEYADDFLRFLEHNEALFPEDQQLKYINDRILNIYTEIRDSAYGEIAHQVKGVSDVTQSIISEIFSKIIDANYSRVRQYNNITYFNGDKIEDEKINEIKEKHNDDIKTIKNKVFESIKLKSSDSRKLTIIGESTIVKNMNPKQFSGIVFAGYGKNEFFPSLISCRLEGLIDNILKCNFRDSAKIDFNNVATIIPFAQTEMVHTFIEGIDPEYQKMIYNNIFTTLNEYSEAILKKYFKDDQYHDKIKSALENINDGLMKKLINKLTDIRQKQYVNSIIDIVVALPKSELASMAESLVNLTSLKRKMSIDSETVGGPIDVALITKGDGFVWIKRKHYFKPELNYQFFQNYFKEGINE